MQAITEESTTDGVSIDPIDLLVPFGATVPGQVRVVNLSMEAAKELSQVVPEHQRPLSNARVLAYAKDMSAGRWRLNNDAIVVVRDPADGTVYSLENGQHRVAARLRAHRDAVVPVLLLEVPEQDANMYLAMDTGKSRSFGDFLKAKGLPDYHHLAAIVRCCLAVDANEGVYPPGKDVARTFPQLWEYLQNAEWDLMKASLDASNRLRSRTGFSGRISGSILYLAARDWSAEETFRFFDMVRAGADPDGGATGEHPTTALYRKIMEIRALNKKRGTVKPYVQWMLVLKALHAYAEGERFNRFTWSPTRERPLPVVSPFMAGTKGTV